MKTEPEEKIVKNWLMAVSIHCVRTDIKDRDDERAILVNPDYLRKVICRFDFFAAVPVFGHVKR